MRLLRRDATLLRLSWGACFALAVGWLVLYIGGYQLKLHNDHPLPEEAPSSLEDASADDPP